MLRARGATYVVLAAPDKETVYPQHGPAWYRGADPNRPAALLSRLAAQSGAIGSSIRTSPWRRRFAWG